MNETTLLLKRAGDAALLDNFEGQYFVEAEFLLFNCIDPGRAIADVFDDWIRQFRPTLRRRTVVYAYFATALATKERFYLLLRIARRLTMKALPGSFFPHGGKYNTARVPDAKMQQVRAKLGHPSASRG